MGTKKYYYTKDDYESFLKDAGLTKEQLEEIRKPTPPSEIEYIKDEKGNKLKSVKSSYVTYKLNVLFGWDWELEILSEEFNTAAREVIVKGRLVINSTRQITRSQFGSAKVEYLSSSNDNIRTSRPINLGFSYKAAASDCEKKCASKLGLFWDVYSGEIKKEEQEKNKITPQEKAKLERFDGFAIESYDKDDIKDFYSKVFPEGKETEASKELLNRHFERIGLTST